MATTEYGDIYVPCEQCGHVSTLRRKAGQAKTHEEQFLTRVCEIIDGLAGILTSRAIARTVAESILELFDFRLSGPEYRVQVYDHDGWWTLKPPLYDLRR